MKFDSIPDTEMPEYRRIGILANQRRHREAQHRILGAILSLRRDGKPLTQRGIRQRAGHGSYSTIGRILRQFKRMNC